MRRKFGLGLVLLLVSTAPAFSLLQTAAQPPAAQQKSTPTSKPTSPSSSSQTTTSKTQISGTKSSMRNWKTYCSEEAEYCISYPPNWDVVGDVMEGNGIVMAPPQNGKDKSQWDEITASVTDLPGPEKGKEPPSFDEILTMALQGLPGNNVRTEQRSQLELHGRDAELVKVRYEDKETGKPWVEEIVFIDDELAIYSIALRATPEDVAELEDTFRKIVASWRPSEAPPAVPAKPAEPKKPLSTAPGATKAPVPSSTPPR